MKRWHISKTIFPNLNIIVIIALLIINIFLFLLQILVTMEGRHGGTLKHLWRAFVYIVIVLKTFMFQLMLKVICRLPKPLMMKLFRRSASKQSTFSAEILEDMSKISWSGTRHFALMFYYDYFKSVQLGTPAIDVDFLDLNGSPCRLFDFCKPGRPLVLNFGSIS